MMKLSGTALVWLSLTLIGLRASVRLKKRTAFFENLLSLVKALQVELEYSVSDLPAVITKIADCELCSGLLFVKNCVEMIKQGIDFPIAWEESVNSSTPVITAEEKDKLVSFGLSLGTTDLQGQTKLIELFTQYITSFYKQAELKQEKYCRIYILSGALTGFGIFILLI